ncbi:MAG TPA: transporter substrate-binding domain-containing protein [Woeseiaceae bacterium]|nr:transporter substrate-binding domain-containing protein [Woeseiaceae bacterium]
MSGLPLPAIRLRRRPAAALLSVGVALILASCTRGPDQQSAGTCDLRVAWDPYEPYSYAIGDADPVGYDIDVVTRLAGLLGCQLSFTEMSWSEVLQALEAGNVDVAVGTGYKKERAEWSWYSESYRKEVLGLMVRKGASETLPAASLEELFRQGFIFGKTIDDTYSATMETTFAEFPDLVRPRVSEEENLRRLLEGSIDGVLIEVNVGSALATRLGVAEELEFHPLAFDAGEYRLQMSKASVSEKTVLRLDAAIQQLNASGWLTEALRKYSIHGRDRNR